MRNASVDLHVHSTYSDGRLEPEELARIAADRKVVAMAVTDHDTVAGAAEKRDACERHGVLNVPGVELSCELDGREAHILSLFLDPGSPYAPEVDALGHARKRRMQSMLERMASMGIDIALEELAVGDGNIFGRPHLARAMMAKGLVKSVNEAFARYLYDDGPIHIPKVRLPAERGIELAKRLGGIAILAHPGVSGLVDSLDRFRELGIDGIETYHPKHGGETIAKILRFCKSSGLLPSGGSDFHSVGDTPQIGSASAPVDILESLRSLALSRSRAAE